MCVFSSRKDTDGSESRNSYRYQAKLVSLCNVSCCLWPKGRSDDGEGMKQCPWLRLQDQRREKNVSDGRTSILFSKCRGLGCLTKQVDKSSRRGSLPLLRCADIIDS